SEPSPGTVKAPSATASRKDCRLRSSPSTTGLLDFGAIVQRLADHGYEGWFVVEAEQDPRKAPPQKMAEIGHAELLRVMTAA
ncbi:hypothetical protein ACC717_37830, partial [Rhizobium ruizarguesonis]